MEFLKIRALEGTNGYLSWMVRFCRKTACDKEGFDINTPGFDRAHLKLRIGIMGNNENDYWTCDSCFGFGISVRGCDGVLRKTTCGNIGMCGFFSNKNTAGFGYIFVQ